MCEQKVPFHANADLRVNDENDTFIGTRANFPSTDNGSSRYLVYLYSEDSEI